MLRLSDEPRLQLIWLLPEISREKLLPGLSGVGRLTVGATYLRFCGTGIGAIDFDAVLELFPQLENRAATKIVVRILHKVSFIVSV